MKKILFLEDRPERLKLFLPEGESDMSVLRSMQHVIMPELEDCKKTLSDINSNKEFNCNEISLIIVHESSLTASGLRYLNEISKQNKIRVILFSGGISQIAYNNDDYDILYINSSDLYSNKFIPFLEKYKNDSSIHLLEVVNPNWRISYWFLLRQLLNTKEIEEKSNEPDYDRIDIIENRIENTYKILENDSSKPIPTSDVINNKIKKLLL